MRLPFPSRGRKPPFPTVKLKSSPLHNTLSALPDVVSTALLALKESADAYPPLKGAVGGVLVLKDIAQRAKHSKSDARDIAHRTEEILNVIADAAPDPSTISAPMLQSIERFTVLLDEISRAIEPIALSGSVSRVVHLNRNDRVIQDIKARLDDVYRDFLVACTLRIEAQQTQLTAQQSQLAVQQAQMHIDVGKVVVATHSLSHDLSSVSFHSRLSVFFGLPLHGGHVS